MPPAPNARDIGAGTRVPSPVTPGHGPRKASAGIRGDLLRRVAVVLGRVPKTGGSYRDPLFERPALVENDYYRFRNQPDDNRQQLAH